MPRDARSCVLDNFLLDSSKERDGKISESCVPWFTQTAALGKHCCESAHAKCRVDGPSMMFCQTQQSCSSRPASCIVVLIVVGVKQ